MVPITKGGSDLGYTYSEFLKHFEIVCKSHLDEGRAKIFAFLFYKPDDFHIKKIIDRASVEFLHLHVLSGQDVSIFHLAADEGQYHQKFNNFFLEGFEVVEFYQPPCFLIFKLEDGNIDVLTIKRLNRQSAALCFLEIVRTIENVKSDLKASKTATINSFETASYLSRVSVEAFLGYIIEKGFSYINY